MSPRTSSGIVAVPRSLALLPLLATALPAQGGLTWHTNPANGSMYAVTATPMTWPQAENLAVSLGGHLATVRNRDENEWLWNKFGMNVATCLWIGFNDVAVEGSFVWSSGEPVTYTNWTPGEPNNQGGEDFVHLWDLGAPGQWNDLPAVGQPPAPAPLGIIELVGPGPGDPGVAYGTGVAGFGDVIPTIETGGEIPVLGNSRFKIVVSNARPAAACVIAGSFARAETPLFGGTIYGDFFTPGASSTWGFVTNGSGFPFGIPGEGRVILSIPIPNDPTLLGFTTYWQGFVMDRNSLLPIGWTHTGGLEVTIQ